MQPAVIFDKDGVLVDSFAAHRNAWMAMARTEGLDFAPAQFTAVFGRTSREVIVCLYGPNRYTEDQIEVLDQQRERAYREVICEQFPAMPDAQELITALSRAGFVLASGSSGPPENAELVLEKLGVRHLFGAVVTGRNVRIGNGRYCLDFTPHSGYAPDGINFEVSGTDPGNASVQDIAMPPVLDNYGKIHLVLIWDAIAGYMAVYTNGVLMGINRNVTLPISAIVNAHSYLGKSSYTGDYCGVATIDEFRMYSGAMATAQIADDYASGPNALPVPKLSVATAGPNLVFTWPDYITGYSLQTSAKLGAEAFWEPAAVSSFIPTNGTFMINVPMTSQQAFYHVIK
jgi:hypothetical protein